MANDNAWRENLKSPGRKLASEASSRISKGQKEGLKKFKGYIYSVGTLGSWKGRGAKDDDDNDDDMKKNVNHGRRANDNAWKEILKSSGRKLASEVSSGISKGQEEGLKVFKGLVYSVGSLGRSKGRGAKDEDDDNDDDMKKNVNHGRKANDNAWREFLKSSGRKLTSDVSSRISKGQEEGLKRFKGFVYSVGSLGRSKGRGSDDDDDSDDDMKKNVNHGRRANDNAWGEILKSSGRKFTSDVSSRISKGQEEGLKRFKGYIYSVSSLGRSKGRGADDNDDNDDDMKSQASQISALSFLSEGMRVLASKGANLFKRGPSPPDDKSASDESMEKFSSIETLMTDVKDADVGLPSISAAAGLRWRDVRMIVRGVRGECYGLAKTVRYRAARRIQVQARMQLARKAMIDRQKSARAARLWGEECRLRRRQRELNFKKRCKQIYRKEGERILEWSLKSFMQPRAVVDLQRVWRGHRARKRTIAYLERLERRARRKEKYERYLNALAVLRGAGDGRSEQIKRRVWGRTEFTHTGWHPQYNVEAPSSMNDHIWNPLTAASQVLGMFTKIYETYGVRTHKILLPPSSEVQRRTLTQDRHAWAGVPVGISWRRSTPARLGPPPRPGTFDAARSVPPLFGAEQGIDRWRMATKYNWLPAPLISKAGLLQTPLMDS